MSRPSFLWYDFETFGADPRRDRPAQFAAIRTDPDLQPLGEPIVAYCRPASDMLPHPAACELTGITPQLAHEKGLAENEFAALIHEHFARPGTCVVGYNNFRFDDEVTRFLLWRNFFDPYAREYANGNSRFDLIDVMRLTRALRPDGLQWPDHDDGKPSFRLEDLAAANGIDASQAHDALADVRATIALAGLLKDRQPRLWQWALGLRDRDRVGDMLLAGQPLLHSSARLGSEFCATAPVLPVARHPRFSGQWLLWNLRVDPTPFLALDDDTLADAHWSSNDDLPEGLERLPIKLVRTNRCPMLAPMTVLDGDARRRLAIDERRAARYARTLEDNPQFRQRLAGLFAGAAACAAADSELDLYGGFPPPGDKRMLARIREHSPDELTRLAHPFADERLNELLFRYRARLWPESLDAAERERWDDYRRRRLIDDPELAGIRWHEFRTLLEHMAARQDADPALVEALAAWPEQIGLPELLDHESTA